MSDLTSEQQQALFLDRNISVSAGAGAGKTRLLVERFLKIAVEHFKGQPQKVRQILAITFTNKAAGEMKERIAMAVGERLTKTEDEKERLHLLRIRDQLNSVAISTIHSFCARILREYPIEAGLAPDFTESDDLQTQMLIADAIEQTLKQVDQTDDEDEFQTYWELFQIIDRKNVLKMLRRALLHPYEMQSVANRFADADEEEFVRFVSDLWLQEIRRLLPEESLRSVGSLILRILPELPPSVPEKIIDLIELLKAGRNLASAKTFSVTDYQTAQTLIRRLTTNDGNAYSDFRQLGGKAFWKGAAGERLLMLSQLCADLSQPLNDFNPGNPPSETDRTFFRAFKIFLRLYERAFNLYEQFKSEIPAVDFEDLLLRTYRLLKSNEFVRRELNERYEFIMVDEFQDTNALQWQIIALLASKDGELEKDKIFIVGDPKQSIYGFRNADIRIFKRVKELMAKGAGFDDPDDYSGNVILKNSFRFLPRLNAFINDLFDSVMNGGSENTYEVEFQPLVAQRKVKDKGYVELALLNDEDGIGEEDYIAFTIDRLINKEKATCFVWQGEEKERPLEFGDIAVLLRSRNNLLTIEQTLRRWGIPFKTVKGIGFWQQQEIFDFYHLLHFLADPSNDFYLVGILRSKLFLLPDTTLYFLSRELGETCWEKLNSELSAGQYEAHELHELKRIRNLLNKWLKLRDFIPLSELLQTVLDDLQYRALLTSQLNGEQLTANIEKFVEHVYRFNSNGISGLVDLIRQVEIFIEEDMKEGEPQINPEDRGAVKLMTIHAAKGLQFPVVFVPYLNTKNTGRSNDSVLLNPEIGLACPMRQESFINNDRFALLNLLKLEKFKKELAEAKRIFYVGVTRASNYLFLSAKTKQEKIQKHSALGWIYEHYRQKNYDLFDPELKTIDQERYSLNIVRHIELPRNEDEEIRTYLQGLQELQDQLKTPEQAEESLLELYRPLEDIPGPVTFSATRLMTYRKDPAEYYRRYHLGFFQNDYELFADAIYQSDDSLIKGKILHRFLEIATGQTRDEDEIIERVLFDFEIFDPPKRRQFGEEVRQLKEKIFNSPIGSKIVRASKARNEVSVTMRLGDDYFTGTIDRIILDERNLWRVIDYKTNRISKDRAELTGKEYEWQMKGYALLLSRLLPEQEEYPVDLYFVHADARYQRRYTHDEIKKIEEEFLELIREIKQKFPVRF